MHLVGARGHEVLTPLAEARRDAHTGAVVLPHDEAGRGPAVVLLHAGIADRTMWAEHLEPLAAAGYRAIAADLPGHGEAPVPPGPQAAWNDVLQTMDALAVDRAALVGSSFGGEVALRVALVAPGRAAALALISSLPPAFEPSAELEAAWETEEAALARGDVDAAIASVLDTWTLPDAPRALRERVAAMQRRAFAAHAQAGEAEHAPDPAEERPELLGRLDLPVLVTAGEREWREVRDGARALAGALPGARHAVIPGAGHLAPLETPEAFRELLLGFLGPPSGQASAAS
jgi:pimeloyl-ACP methyl ester carboxylesterase